MPKEQYIVGLDLGSYYIKASAITGKNGDIIFSVFGESAGIMNGIITDEVRLIKSIRDVIRKLEIKIGQPIKTVYLSVDIGNTKNELSTGATGILSEIVTDDEIYRAVNSSLRFPTVFDDGIADIDIYEYKIDGKEVDNPNGKKGALLDLKTQVFFVKTKLVEEINRLLRTEGIELYGTGVQMRGISNLLISSAMKKEGILVVDCGDTKTDMCVIQDGIVKAVKRLDIAGKNITKDLSIVLKVPMEEAEELKKSYGKGILSESDGRFELVKGVILARIDEILDEIKDFLSDEGYLGNIHNSCITGGGLCGFRNIQKYAEDRLNLSTKAITSDIIKSDDIFTLNSVGVAYDIIHDIQTETQLENWDKILVEENKDDESYIGFINKVGQKAKSSVKTIISPEFEDSEDVIYEEEQSFNDDSAVSSNSYKYDNLENDEFEDLKKRYQKEREDEYKDYDEADFDKEKSNGIKTFLNKISKFFTDIFNKIFKGTEDLYEEDDEEEDEYDLDENVEHKNKGLRSYFSSKMKEVDEEEYIEREADELTYDDSFDDEEYTAKKSSKDKIEKLKNRFGIE